MMSLSYSTILIEIIESFREGSWWQDRGLHPGPPEYDASTTTDLYEYDLKTRDLVVSPFQPKVTRVEDTTSATCSLSTPTIQNLLSSSWVKREKRLTERTEANKITGPINHSIERSGEEIPSTPQCIATPGHACQVYCGVMWRHAGCVSCTEMHTHSTRRYKFTAIKGEAVWKQETSCHFFLISRAYPLRTCDGTNCSTE
jgi:hypothetical protein